MPEPCGPLPFVSPPMVQPPLAQPPLVQRPVMPPLEQRSFVPPGWYILCRASHLKQKPLRLPFAGQALVAFRTADGSIGVLEDRCAHRAAPLSGGKVCGQHVQCPYHGWEYDRHGQVSMVPALAQCPEKWQGTRVGAWFACEQQGFIWIRHETTAATVPANAARPPQFAHFNLAAGAARNDTAPNAPPLHASPPPAGHSPGWSHFVMQTRFHATVEACLENFLDCPHATFVHRYWFRAPTQKRVKAVVRTLEDGAEAEFFEEPREKSLVWWLLAPKQGSMRHIDRFIAPNTSRVDYEFPAGLHYIITSSCTPLSPTETMVYTVMSFRYKWLGALVRLFFEPLSRWIIRQDAQMLASQQRNLDALAASNQRDSSPASPFCSTEADLLGSHIVQWRKAMLRGEAPPQAGQQREVEIML